VRRSEKRGDRNKWPGSQNYSDLLPLWDVGKYFPLAYSRRAVEKKASEKLVLEPNVGGVISLIALTGNLQSQ